MCSGHRRLYVDGVITQTPQLQRFIERPHHKQGIMAICSKEHNYTFLVLPVWENENEIQNIQLWHFWDYCLNATMNINFSGVY